MAIAPTTEIVAADLGNPVLNIIINLLDKLPAVGDAQVTFAVTTGAVDGSPLTIIVPVPPKCFVVVTSIEVSFAVVPEAGVSVEVNDIDLSNLVKKFLVRKIGLQTYVPTNPLVTKVNNTDANAFATVKVRDNQPNCPTTLRLTSIIVAP